MDQAQTTQTETTQIETTQIETSTTEASTTAPQMQNANFIAVVVMTWMAILNF